MDIESHQPRAARLSGPLAYVSSGVIADAIIGLFEAAGRFIAEHETTDYAARPRVVLVSRRLSCTYDMLVAAETIQPLDTFGACEVVVDRVLEAEPRWHGAPVLVLDDVLIHGRTLATRYDDIEKDNPDSHIAARVAAVREGADGSLIRRLWPTGEAEPILRISADAADRYAREIAVCMYRSMTPYFSDFPMVDVLEIPRSSVAELVATQRWSVADVTLPIADLDQAAYTFLPSVALKAKIRAGSLALPMELASLLKVRIFVRDGRDADHLRVRIVPIGVAAPALPGQLEQVIEDIRTATGSGLGSANWHNAAKHRLVQMYLSAIVLAEFWRDLERVWDSCPSIDPAVMDMRHARSYFESDRVDAASSAFIRVVADYYDRVDNPDPDRDEHEPAFFPVSPSSPPFKFPELRAELVRRGWFSATARMSGYFAAPTKPAPGEVAQIPMLWAQTLLNAWAALALNYQEAERQKVLADPDDLEALDRYDMLRSGFVISELNDLMMKWIDVDDEWQGALISLVLDIGNDLGIVVPSTHDEARSGRGGRAVFRQYRAGENAPVAGTPPWLLATDAQNALAVMDPFTRWALGIPEDAAWDQLTESTQSAVREVAAVASAISSETDEGRVLIAAREGEITDVSHDVITASVRPLTFDGTFDRAEFERVAFDTDRSLLRVGHKFVWYTLGPAPGRAGIEHKFDFASEPA